MYVLCRVQCTVDSAQRPAQTLDLPNSEPLSTANAQPISPFCPSQGKCGLYLFVTLSHYAALTEEFRCYSENVTQMASAVSDGDPAAGLIRHNAATEKEAVLANRSGHVVAMLCYGMLTCTSIHLISPSNSRPILYPVEHLFTLGVTGGSRVDTGLELDRARWNHIHLPP